ncbi:MAG: hypothetical protein HY394_05875 [Candidatus Diapherotrites archaeon]|nr:hypothetical protein [Candidatus Diapherotrites archaeon]
MGKLFVLGIDFGASTTDIVLFGKRKIVRSWSFPAMPVRGMQKFLKSLGMPFEKIRAVAVTGGRSMQLHGKKVFGVPVRHVSEIDAIGLGGAFLAGKKSCLVASLGTGTCIVEMRNGKSRHFGGTGVGGGTLLGLASLLLGAKNVFELEALAAKGRAQKIDLSVGDIMGKGIGVVPVGATGSNFAKLSSSKKEDAAAALVKMVAEVNAVSIIFASRAAGLDEIVVVGKTPEVKGFRKRMQTVAGYYSKNLVFPKNAGIATAIGACLKAQGSANAD